MDIPDFSILIIILIMFGISFTCILVKLIGRIFVREPQIHRQEIHQPIQTEIPHVTFLVQGDPEINISRDTISIVPYRNNHIYPTQEIDASYIHPVDMGEKDFHPAVYAVWVQG